jgi:putative oxidoreductase
MFSRLIRMYHTCVHRLTPLQDALLFAMRIWIAAIFWYSGLSKIDDWDTTLFLFEEEYMVPFISATFAAYSATFLELLCPVLLLLGLGTRIAALPLIAMTAVIQFTYLPHEQHYYWGFLLLSLVVFGAGRLSLDHAATIMAQRKA